MPRYKRIKLNELIVDPSYQRELDARRVATIAEDSDPALLGTLEVSRRNGKCAIFDGQHRYAALKERNATDAPCIVHEDLSVADEAMLFVKLQTQRKALSPWDRFRARLRAGDEVALAINIIAEKYDFSVNDNSSPGSIGAITALDRVYARGGEELLDATLSYLTYWHGEPRSTDGAIIDGLARAIEIFGADKRWQEGIETALQATPATTVLRKAVARLEAGGGSSSRPIAVAKEFGRLVGIRGPYKKRAAKATA